MQFERKNIRLAAKSYRGRGWFFITLCCDAGRQVFADGQKARWLISCLRREAEASPFGIHAFCVMPDHVHLLVEGQEPASDLPRFLKAWKQRTGFLYQREFNERLWQKKFYDHVLRPHDSADAVAWYLWMNPVREGICPQPREYPYCGSFTVPWKKATPPEESWIPPWKRKGMPA
jgi:putative transposase